MNKCTFVIPFAGGTSNSFFSWSNRKDYKNFVFLDFPGKGKRVGESFLKTFEEYVFFATTEISKYILLNNITNYNLWGHSMGSLISYEIVKRFIRDKILLPKKLIMTSTLAPCEIDYYQISEVISDKEAFIHYVISMGLVSEKVANSEIFQKHYLKMIYNDYKVISKYNESKIEPIQQNTLIINGTEDCNISNNQMLGWSRYFTDEPTYKLVKGNHFFIFNKSEEVFNMIDKF